MVRAAVAGIGGRMGSRIAQILKEEDGIQLVGGFERAGHPAVGQDVSSITGGAPTGLLVSGSFQELPGPVDVVIDFTTADASLANLQAAAERKPAMVIGSTGFTPPMLEKARSLARSIPCVLAPNMSVGVNVLFKVVEELTRLLGPAYDVEIVETHHRFKKDAPSGTALRLAEAAAAARGRRLEEVGVFERHGLIGERPEGAIGVQTLRGGDVVGEHTVLFAGMGERIEVTHRAHSRDNFARGAVHAAKWVVTQPPGLYDMQDVLKLR
ncbi:dihydrodipicolinate reductase [Desulfacinum hydrothermale DSM 13146]|uniref:4-hydroxy-tetrahydrodipicolinate reductase n=1 Tax=Desulfacinum hydrothermale DSM 13146 TaxID=1121390 RepID=A0A1W1X9G7_9BACT|nr:4-hydroxy-tetrahydrodipicolinate reductase [Desulfacinum hydrothermale]SMC20161.1 dihydrodipicolinate reductase [Desulfacinum hydrothermale DSM 13146]